MRTVSVADAKAHLSDLVAKAAAGETVTITKHGKPVAQLTAVHEPLERIDLAELQALTGTIPPQPRTAGDFIRTMRDEDRY
ncbi:type II toxin-antitoxin system Phd/YefM family antitoxin [Aquibium carbonis]|uniref:Antitoxin n=1 Tax=Aquibium carbonis TaxID=2495581 RepID=A0A429YN16_9HYPH|nr:type II toxin-antitoxin system prevent-host-death family antitoxin [Aquibium carbonis]RST82820.1 type II toxin-antitoxin system Phd/YefM family antitoxin [Aquibium carbonis]